MEQSTALIDLLTDFEAWANMLDASAAWINENILQGETLAGIALVLLSAGVSWPVANNLKLRLEDYSRGISKHKITVLFWKTLSRVIYPAIWLLFIGLCTVVSNELGLTLRPLAITSSLLAAWIIIQLATIFVESQFWGKTIVVFAWSIAALNIVGLLDQTASLLDQLSFSFGQVTISVLTVIQAIIILGVLLWITSLLGHLAESRLRSSSSLTPSVQVLSVKLIYIALGTMAFIAALAIVGVDLTALAVFSGFIGVGLGFGLQRIFANLVSGFILLVDKSIKPGDVIAVAGYFGRVDSLGARYVSVSTRDGIEHLIPNEEIVVNRVENWSHTQNLLRLRKGIGIHYKSDLHKAIALCIEAAHETDRVLDDPKANCLVTGFEDSSVGLELRFWINDPMNGRGNVISEVLLKVWDKFHANGIEIPYPQRDLHLRSSEIGQLPNDNESS